MLRFWTFKRLAIALVYAAFCMPIMLVRADMPPIMIDSYHVTINAETYQSGKVTIIERVTLESGWLDNWRADHPNMNLDGTLELSRLVDVTSTSGIYTIAFNPLSSDDVGDIILNVTKGVTRPVQLEGRMCDYNCKPADVQVINIPSDVLLQQKNATGITTSSYDGKDMVTWSLMDLRQGIAFNFVPPAALGLKSIIKAFLDHGLVGQISLTIAAIIGFLAGIIAAILRPRIIAWFDKRIFGKVKATTA